MKISSDLKHVLENVHNGNKCIILAKGILFYYSGNEEYIHTIVKVIKKGKIWKMLDEYSNEYTISTLDNKWQHSLYMNLLSMEDNRCKPVDEVLTLESL